MSGRKFLSDLRSQRTYNLSEIPFIEIKSVKKKRG